MPLSESEFDLANDFLNRCKALYKTNDFVIEHRDKNIQFDKEYSLTVDEKKEILNSLLKTDCYKMEKNDNPNYPDAMVYFFKKNCEIDVFGETKEVELYIKKYIDEKAHYCTVDIISFHESGMIGG